MPLSSKTMRGAIRYLPGAGKLAAVNRFVAWLDDTTPDYGHHIRPTAQPSGTAAKGDFYFDSTTNSLTTYSGNAWTAAGGGGSYTAAATADGLTTGIVPEGVNFVTVTSANANNIITLPAPTPGRVIRFRNGATGYELRSSAPATVAINGGTGTAAESAIAANILTQCVCGTATTWICTDYAAAGTFAASEVAAP